MGLPVGHLGVMAAFFLQRVLQQEGHHFDQTDGDFFGVGEAGHRVALHQRRAVRCLGVEQYRRRVAHGADRFAGCVEGFDHRDGMPVVHQVPQRTVATGVEEGVVVPRLQAGQHLGVGQRPACLVIVAKAAGRFGLRVRVVAFRVQRRVAALGGSQHHRGAGIAEREVGGGEFLQPETGLLAGVAQLVMGGQYHEDLHRELLAGSVSNGPAGYSSRFNRSPMAANAL
ncbi:hypothetical protein D9M68_338880 [compost metagenome]